MKDPIRPNAHAGKTVTTALRLELDVAREEIKRLNGIIKAHEGTIVLLGDELEKRPIK